MAFGRKPPSETGTPISSTEAIKSTAPVDAGATPPASPTSVSSSPPVIPSSVSATPSSVSATPPSAPTTKTANRKEEISAQDRNRYDQFRLTVHNALMSRMDLNAAARLSPDQLRRQMEQFVSEFAYEQRMQLNEREQKQIANEVVNDMIGLGPLEELLADQAIADIMVNGPHQVYVEKGGKIQLTTVKFRDETHLLQIAQRIANSIGRRVDEASPMVDARLADGSRVNIIIPPLAIDGSSISIRKFSKSKISLEQMAQGKSMSPELAKVLQIASACRLNILVSGGTGSGKTTLLNALSRQISPDERVVTIEDAAELQLQQPHVVRLESRPSNLEGKGEVTIRDLVKNSLRMRPDRIIIGEVRGSEALDLLQAMNTGHDGSMGTVHANSAREAITRVENMVAMSGFGLPAHFVRTQIASAVHLIVQTERMRDGQRRVTQLAEVVGMEGDIIQTQDLFKFEYEGETRGGALVGAFRSAGIRPRFSERAAYYGLERELMLAITG